MIVFEEVDSAIIFPFTARSTVLGRGVLIGGGNPFAGDNGDLCLWGD